MSLEFMAERIILYYLCMYVYSREGPHSALAPRPSLIYCAYYIVLNTDVVLRLTQRRIKNLKKCLAKI
jgi:hypothetical protein